jgi:hypothetical protein
MSDSSLWDITATDLHQWAERLEARAIMPRLIRRLILATAQQVHRIGFPADESTQLGGYDGIVQLQGGLPHAPDGQSVWEIGVNKDIKDKADDDYEKRKKTPGAANSQNTTFVFATPRRWGGKDKWVTARRKEAFWRDVWVIDADHLEQWLEQAAAVAAWLGMLIGKRFDGVTDLQESWDVWSHRTQPAISTGLIMAGRGEAADALVRWLDAPPTAIRLRADTAAEALAYFAAFVSSLRLDRQVALLARTAVVSSATALARLRGGNRPLVIIPNADWDAQAHLAVRNGHHVLLPVGRETPEDGQNLQLPAIPRRELENGLRGMGLEEDRARELARESRGQLAILTRLLGRGPTAMVPSWASPAEGSQLTPVLLAGAWNRDSAADRDAVQRLAGRPYAEIEALAVRWHSTSDSPLRLTGSIWEWISRDDGWYHLGSRIGPTLLDNFERTALEVLGMPDPRYTLPPDERWAAAMHGQVPRHSGHLRESLAHSLALLALRATVGVGAGAHQARVDGIVRRLLGRGNGPRLWPSLSGLLPLLAEAAPDAFLACLEETILLDDQARLAMFEQEGLWGGSPHTGLLWALEALAWPPLHLTRVTVALGRLAARDPGGRLANRPINSLREIFLTWLPHTKANLNERLQAIDVLAARESGVAWDLCMRLLPHAGEHSTPTHVPRWRTWQEGGGARVTARERLDTISALVERLLDWVDTDGRRWAELLDALSRVPRPLAQRIIRQLRQFAGSTAPAADRLLVWEALRKAVRFQRQVLEPRRGRLPGKLLNALDRIYRLLEPTAIRPRFLWLFTDHPELPDLDTDDWGVELQAIEQARRQAVDTVMAAEGTDGLLRLAHEAEQARTVGWAAGASALTEEQILPLLEACIDAAEAKYADCGRGPIMARFSQAGPAWPQSFFASGPGRNWPLERRIAFAHGLPRRGETWDLVTGWGPDADRGYWRSVPINWLDEPARDMERCISSLHAAGRPWAALHLIGMCICSSQPKAALPPALVLTILDAASQTDPAREAVPVGRRALDCIDGVLDHLEGTGQVHEAELARVEWTYLPVLRHLRRGSPVLERMLAREPAMFVEVLASAFRSEKQDRTNEVPDAQTVARATHAYHLLERWSLLPGTRSDGSFDQGALNGWVDRARALCQERGYSTVGDQRIGQILACVPAGSDGHWPHEVTRDLIERLESVQLERGLYIGLRNSRGVTSRAPEEGGRQERELAARYSRSAEACASKYPRTTCVLRAIASAYEEDARREDQESALAEYE